MAPDRDAFGEELAALRELGREFAAAHPEAAPFLAAEGSDPDVERLLEGVAFLTAGIRERLDQDCPDLCRDLLDLLWPCHQLPTPSFAMVQLAPLKHAREAVPVPRGTLLDARPLDGTRCRFATCHDLLATPLGVTAMEWADADRLRLRIDAPVGCALPALAGPRLRLHLVGDPSASRWLRWRLLEDCRGVRVRCGASEASLPSSAVAPVGFARHEALLPGLELSPLRLRLLREWLVFPEQFLSLDVLGLDRVEALRDATAFELCFELARCAEPPPRAPIEVTLNCTPAVNVFASEADPIRFGGRGGERLVRAAGDPSHHEVYQVAAATAISAGGAERRRCVEAHRRRWCDEDALGYRLRRWPRCDGDGSEVGLRIDDPLATPEALSLALRCTNRSLAARLGVGEIDAPGPGAPPALRVRNIGKPTTPLPAPAPARLQARLSEHLALHAHPLADLDGLRRLLALCDPRANAGAPGTPVRRLVDSFAALRSAPALAFADGAPLRGCDTVLDIEASDLSPELRLFTAVFERALAGSAGINRFSRVRLVDPRRHDLVRYPARLGSGEP